MAQRKSKIAGDILKRVRWLYVIFLLTALAIVGKILWIQYGPEGAELRSKSRRITFERVAIEAERGDILAGDGRILATSIPKYEIRMDFAAPGLSDTVFYNNVDSLARCLSDFFRDKSQAAYKQLLTSSYNNKSRNRYKLISPRRVDYLEEKAISRFPIFRLGANKGGYIKVRNNERIKPHRSLASRTIGSVNQAGDKYGIEGAFDEHLRGKDGQTLMQRVSGSFRVPVQDQNNIDPVDGMDVVTTIDVDIQDVAETALRQQLEKHNADWGTVILMEVESGEIHAMSNLTRQSSGSIVEDFNYAIGRRLEPGSTFKLATLITLLEDGKMSLDEMIDCENGRARVGRRVVVDDHPEGVISLQQVFNVSSNIGFAKAVNNIYGEKPERFVNFIDKMGFGNPLGVQIGGEADPLLKRPGGTGWDGTSLVMMSYGYALEVTPMHTLVLYNAVANNGRMVRPKLVKEIRNYGEPVKTFPTEVINSSICSKTTVQKVRDCLESVVDEGTGRLMRSAPYKSAVKTGTAQVAMRNGGYTDSRGGRDYLATFVGYFPADNPRYSCIVAIKTYHGPGNRNTYYGASLSGPVFRAIADRVYAAHPEWHEKIDGKGPKTEMTQTTVKAGSAEALRKIAQKVDLPFNVPRRSSAPVAVAEIVPEREPGDTIPVRSDWQLNEIQIEPGKVPSVVGMGLRDAVHTLESLGLKVTYAGQGMVKSQSVAAGTELRKGQTVHLTLNLR